MRYPALDALRGIASFAVLTHHCVLAGLIPISPVVGPGALALHAAASIRERPRAGHLFFVLSGFVLAVSLEGRSLRPGQLRRLRRLCRIYLPYAAVVLIAAIRCSGFAPDSRSGRSWAGRPHGASRRAAGLVAAAPADAGDGGGPHAGPGGLEPRPRNSDFRPLPAAVARGQAGARAALAGPSPCPWPGGAGAAVPISAACLSTVLGPGPRSVRPRISCRSLFSAFCWPGSVKRSSRRLGAVPCRAGQSSGL